ncbi:MAG: sulfatase-like hydrolase/transferase [Spirochaetes bacterium]|nr:sulfatase-like hydrolase/transferase [Spirochaetota bacterium]
MKPNVIVFFTDQQRWDTSNLSGNPLNLMPNFTRMAGEGTFFENAFTCQPVCAPARASLQTGLFATQTGVFRNGLHLKKNTATLAECFNKAGYKTGYIGKWHLGGVNPGFKGGQEPVPEERRGGYRYWLASNLPEFMSDAYNAVLFDNDNNLVKLPGYRVDAYTDAAIRYMNKNKNKPFFLFLSFLEPHAQNTADYFPAPDGYREEYTGKWMPPDLGALGGSAYKDTGGYFGMVKRLDEALGRILDALKSLNILEDTIVIFTSDHGNHFKTRNSEYKRSCHESSIHIPAAAQGPGFNGGGHVSALVSIVDFTPTILDAAGIDIPGHMAGCSILPLLRKETTGWQDDIFVQISESQVGRAVRTHRWKYSVKAEGKDPWKDASAGFYREEFLYDLKADPYELVNLIGIESHRKVADVMKSRLIRRMELAGEKKPVIYDSEVKTDSEKRRVSDSELYE